jgi:hypothetical protein
MPFPDLSPLPDWVEALAYGVLAVSLAVIWVLSRLGFLKGKATPPAERQDAREIAAMVVDSGAIKSLSSAIEATNITLAETNKIAREFLEDMRAARDEADREAARREGYEAGLAAGKSVPRSRPRSG